MATKPISQHQSGRIAADSPIKTSRSGTKRRNDHDANSTSTVESSSEEESDEEPGSGTDSKGATSVAPSPPPSESQRRSSFSDRPVEHAHAYTTPGYYRAQSPGVNRLSSRFAKSCRPNQARTHHASDADYLEYQDDYYAASSSRDQRAPRYVGYDNPAIPRTPPAHPRIARSPRGRLPYGIPASVSTPRFSVPRSQHVHDPYSTQPSVAELRWVVEDRMRMLQAAVDDMCSQLEDVQTTLRQRRNRGGDEEWQ